MSNQLEVGADVSVHVIPAMIRKVSDEDIIITATNLMMI